MLRKYLLAFLPLFVAGSSSCEGMAYEKFLAEFKQSCPNNYKLKDSPQPKSLAICDCMYKTILEQWPDLESLHTALRKLDREPRGYTDFLHGSVRLTEGYCTDKDIVSYQTQFVKH
jgi:hypothetical protein